MLLFSFCFASRSGRKEITIGKLTWTKTNQKKKEDIYILHYKYVKCTSLYTSTEDGLLMLRPNRSTIKNKPKEKQKQHIKIWFMGQEDCWPKTSLFLEEELVFR